MKNETYEAYDSYYKYMLITLYELKFLIIFILKELFVIINLFLYVWNNILFKQLSLYFINYSSNRTLFIMTKRIIDLNLISRAHIKLLRFHVSN